jgi:hypothetical protein
LTASVAISTGEASALASGAAPILIATSTTRLVKQKTASQIVLIIQDPRNRPFDAIPVIRPTIQPDSGDLATPQHRGASAVDMFTNARGRAPSVTERNRKGRKMSRAAAAGLKIDLAKVSRKSPMRQKAVRNLFRLWNKRVATKRGKRPFNLGLKKGKNVVKSVLRWVRKLTSRLGSEVNEPAH